MAKKKITLEDLAQKIDKFKSDLTQKIDGVESGLTKKIGEVESGLIEKIDGVESGLTEKIGGVKNDLRQEIIGVEKKLSKKIGDETGGLAAMTKRGFDKAQEENQKHFSIIEQEIVDVKLRQDNVAYRFELNALGERVTKLEKAH